MLLPTITGNGRINSTADVNGPADSHAAQLARYQAAQDAIGSAEYNAACDAAMAKYRAERAVRVAALEAYALGIQEAAHRTAVQRRWDARKAQRAASQPVASAYVMRHAIPQWEM